MGKLTNVKLCLGEVAMDLCKLQATESKDDGQAMRDLKTQKWFEKKKKNDTASLVEQKMMTREV